MRRENKILIKPELKTMYLKNNNHELVTYLEVPLDYYMYSLQKDIEQGAGQYVELQEIIKKPKVSRIVAISADSREMGLMAVTYLSMHLLCKSVTGIEPTFDPGFDGYPTHYYESGEKIPVLSVSEINRYMRRDEHSFEQGSFLVLPANIQNKNEPYWRQCTRESICLIADRGSMTEDSLNVINLFSGNKQVYVIFLENKEKDLDFDELPFGMMDRKQFRAFRNNFILSYAADEFTVSFGEKPRVIYYKNILKHNLKQRGVKVKRGFSYDKVVNLAMYIDKKNICEMIDKTVNYALKDMDDCEDIVLENKDFKFIDHFLREKTNGEGQKKGCQLLEENLVGIQEIKQQVYDSVNVMKYHRIRKRMNISGSQYHNVHVILGAPGTAKTTVAQYMGQMMFDEKLLPDSRSVCINGAELKGMYVGHSAPKTKALFEKYDVIIIDEAYSIVDSVGVVDSFGNEAIAQLIIELEKHSTDKLVIFAGYGGEDVEQKDNRMKDFLEANPGIKSRITSTFYFRSYNPEEMSEIFLRIAHNANYMVEDGVKESVKRYFEGRVDDPDFGNGREARSLLENTTLFAARRLMGNGKKCFMEKEMKLLTLEDVELAIEKAGAGITNANLTKRNRIGFAC